MLNTVCLVGRMVADPEVRQTPSGTAVGQFRIAVDRNYVKQGEERQADFITCVAWGHSADFVSKYFKKGSPIAVQGSLRTRSYQDKNGNNRIATEVVANELSFVPSDSTRPRTAAPASQPTARPQAAPPTAYSQGNFDEFAPIDDTEDLPFF